MTFPTVKLTQKCHKYRKTKIIQGNELPLGKRWSLEMGVAQNNYCVDGVKKEMGLFEAAAEKDKAAWDFFFFFQEHRSLGE